jgi:hypothetical protein
MLAFGAHEALLACSAIQEIAAVPPPRDMQPIDEILVSDEIAATISRAPRSSVPDSDATASWLCAR